MQINDADQMQKQKQAYEQANKKKKILVQYLNAFKSKDKRKKRQIQNKYPEILQQQQVVYQNFKNCFHHLHKTIGWQKLIDYGFINSDYKNLVISRLKRKQKEFAILIYKNYKLNQPLPNHIQYKLIQQDSFAPYDLSNVSLQQLGFQITDYLHLDNIQKIQQFYLNCVQQEILSIDCQWNPIKNNSLSIVQLATSSKLYLFDYDKSNLKINKQFSRILIQIFINKKIKIIGLGFQNDFNRLNSKFQLNLQYSKLNIIDISYNIDIKPQQFQYQKKISLANLTKKILNKQLEKQQTMSNWQRRPLRKRQLHYALLDAYICIYLYKHINNLTKQQRIEIYGKTKTKQDIDNQKKEKKKQKTQRREEKKRKRQEQRILKQKQLKQNKMKEKQSWEKEWRAKEQKRREQMEKELKQREYKLKQEIIIELRRKQQQCKKIQQQKRKDLKQLIKDLIYGVDLQKMSKIYDDMFKELDLRQKKTRLKRSYIFTTCLRQVLKQMDKDMSIQSIIDISDIFKQKRIDLIYYQILYYQIQNLRYKQLTLQQKVKLVNNIQYIQIQAIDHYIFAFKLDRIPQSKIINQISKNVKRQLRSGNIKNAFTYYQLFNKPKSIKHLIQQDLQYWKSKL